MARIVTGIWSWIRPAGNAVLYFLPYIALSCFTTKVVHRQTVSFLWMCVQFYSVPMRRQEKSDNNAVFLQNPVFTMIKSPLAPQLSALRNNCRFFEKICILWVCAKSVFWYEVIKNNLPDRWGAAGLGLTLIRNRKGMCYE